MKTRRAILLFAALACSCYGDSRLRFTRAADLPDGGLRLLLPAGAEADPLPPPAIMDGFRETGKTRERLELQSPLEVWRWRQREGRWTDPRGNRVILATASLPAPDGPADWLPRAEVERMLSVRPEARAAWSPGDLARWLEFFWGAPGMKAEPLSRSRPFALAEALLFRRPAPEAGLACAFRLKAKPELWRFVLVEPAPGAAPGAAEKAFVEELLPSIQAAARRGPDAAASSPAASSGKPLTPREESLRRARESIRNMKGWWAVEGSNTVVLSDIKAGKSQLVDAVAEDLEAMRPVWEAEVPPWEPAREVAVIRVFGTPEAYVRYVGPGQAWTSGLWVPARRELAIRPLEEGSVLRSRRAVLGTIYHEAFHQYLDEAFGRLQAAPWFNEGYAQLFASLSMAGRRVNLDKEPEAAALLALLARSGKLDLAGLFPMTYADFYRGDEAVRREHYAMAWGLMYFLREGGRKAEPWRGVPGRYAAALRDLRDPSAATARALEGVDMNALNAAFRQYWK
jgi:hypothetical protein